ncbi:MAG TPA: hypothetical protein VLM85_30940 [Polyangiaceae bacterium]|nr:hypothetical protein [Polyangiaceae bacterium]
MATRQGVGERFWPYGSGVDLRWLEHVHGHAGWLAAATLIHPAILLRKPNRRAPWSVWVATLVTTLVCVAGGLLYGPYRAILKQRIFQTAPSIGLLFERKEHLAFGALLFAWIGALAYVAASRGKPSHATLRKLSQRSFAIAAALAVVVAALGTAVAVFRTF